LLVDENQGQVVVIEITIVYAGVGFEILAIMVVEAREGRRQEAAAIGKGVDIEAVLNILVFWFNFLGINVKNTEDLLRNY
jgi:hypothetical protein